jgi:hypothetical protein
MDAILDGEEEPMPRTEVTDTIDLDPRDWFVATWRPLPPLSRPDPAPFDLPACLEKLRQAYRRDYDTSWQWRRIELPEAMTAEEATFWLTAMSGAKRSTTLAAYVGSLRGQSFAEVPSVEGTRDRLRGNLGSLTAEVLLPLANLFPPEQILEILLDEDITGRKDTTVSRYLLVSVRMQLARGFARHVYPYLDGPTREALRWQVAARCEPDEWLQHMTQNAYANLPTAYYLAPVVGAHEEVRRVVAGWPDGKFRSQGHYGLVHSFSAPWPTVLGLGDPDLVRQHVRRLGLVPCSPEHAAGYLAHTGAGDLEYFRKAILSTNTTALAEALLGVLARVRSPAVAPLMLEIQLRSRAPRLARRWLQEEVGNATVGLLPLAGGRSTLADAARAHLRLLARAGFRDTVDRHIKTLRARDAARLREAVLEDIEPDLPVHADQTTPRELRRLLARWRPEPLPEWIDPLYLPPLAVRGRRLNEDQVKRLVTALRQGQVNWEEEGVPVLRRVSAPGDLERFAWGLADAWLGHGAPRGGDWCLRAVGLWGGETSAFRLAGLLRGWSGSKEKARVRAALQTLCRLGAPFDHMQLDLLAREHRAPSVRDWARETLQQIAGDLGSEVEVLLDRSVPTLGLDLPEGRCLRLGRRHFRMEVGPGNQAVLRDEKGKHLTALPRIRARERRQATEVREEWQEFKRHLAEVARWQAARLEEALIDGRRWEVGGFERWLVRHPVQGHLTRLLLWSAFNRGGRRAFFFRVSEEGEYADLEGRPCPWEKVRSVGLAHPAELSERERLAWGEVWGDFELIPPFPQLGRPVVGPAPEEAGGRELTRFAGLELPDLALSTTLKAHGWQLATVPWRVRGRVHCRPFRRGSVTGVVFHEYSYRPAPHAVLSDRRKISWVCFLEGLRVKFEAEDLNPRKGVPLGEIDPVVIAEVLNALGVLAGKAD